MVKLIELNEQFNDWFYANTEKFVFAVIGIPLAGLIIMEIVCHILLHNIQYKLEMLAKYF